MPVDFITYQSSGYFSKIILDYLNEKPELKSFFNRFPKIENFDPKNSGQILEKDQNFDFKIRSVLVSELEKQYKKIEKFELTSKNIKLLNKRETYTITTGHQLNLFTGPIFFFYKIISAINLCKQLKTKYPENNFVPVYWMASEDHDFKEINHFRVKEKKITWDHISPTGPVGRITNEGLNIVYDLFAKELGNGINAQELKKKFEDSYLKHDNLADSTLYLVNNLFGHLGLVILDGDNFNLKREFIPYIKDELINQSSFKEVSATIANLNYDIQVNPREINLFYIEDNLRERIILENKTYRINNTNIQFTEIEIIEELEKHPEKFSPNVILRPLFQEVILPNLCYIGGGGEIAYWLELKSMFDYHKITFPMLLLRNSALLVTKKQASKADKLKLSWEDLFMNQQSLFNKKTKLLSKLSIDFTNQKKTLQKQFEFLYIIATQTDKSFIGAVKAQEIKQIKGLENLEKRLLKAEKRSYSEWLERMILLQKELFPEQKLQERQLNFSDFYLEYGAILIDKLTENLKPLEQNFEIIII
jgi:bacillithiol synthase